MIPILALAGAIVTNSVSHLMFRRAAQQRSLFPIILVAMSFTFVPICTWVALHGLTVSQVYMALAISPLLIAALGWIFLRERFPARATMPYAMILAGCILFYL